MKLGWLDDVNKYEKVFVGFIKRDKFNLSVKRFNEIFKSRRFWLNV